MSGVPASYTGQIRVENDVTYYTGSSYPDKAFFDAHWTYGKGSTLVIPSALVWDQITTKVPEISNLAAVEKILTTQAGQYPVGSAYANSGVMGVNFYKAYSYQVTEGIPYSLGNSGLWADMNFTKINEHVVQGSVTYTLKPDRFDWIPNAGDDPIAYALKYPGSRLAGLGTAFDITYSGSTALKIEATVADVGPATGINDGKYYPVETSSTRRVISNYQPPSGTPTGTEVQDAVISVITHPDLGTPARNSSNYAILTGAHTAELIPNQGGGVDDIWVLKGGQAGTGFSKEDFRAGVLACNPDMTNLNNIPGGAPLYIPQKFSDGSITYHYAGGASINSNPITGAYQMVVPDGEGGTNVYSRTPDEFGYSVSETRTDATGNTVYQFNGYQETLDGPITSISATTETDTNADGDIDQIQYDFDTDADGLFDQTIDTGDSLQQMLDAERQLDALHTQNEFDDSYWQDFTDWATQQLLNAAAPPAYAPPTFDFIPEYLIPDYFLSLDPIGAFYDSQSAAYDHAPALVDQTPVLLDASNQAITAAQLAARDTNHDGQLSGAELNTLKVWADQNEDGQLTNAATSSEIQSLNTWLSQHQMTSIAAGDYGFYTQGNARYLDTAQRPNTTPLTSLDPNTGAPAHLTAPTRTQSAAASNYRTLRDTDNRYNIAGGPGQIVWYYIDWTPGMVKINQGTPNSLIGTDNADSMDAAYYASYLGSYAKFFNLDLLTNFYAGGGDDQFGGSARNDNIWGGLGNDVLYGYAGDDHLYGEEGDDVLLGQDGNDVLIDAVDNWLPAVGGRAAPCMLFA